MSLPDFIACPQTLDEWRKFVLPDEIILSGQSLSGMGYEVVWSRPWWKIFPFKRRDVVGWRRVKT